MTTLLIALAAGCAIGLIAPRLGAAIGRTLTPAVFGIIAIQGAVLGSTDEVASALGRTLLHGVLLAAAMSAAVVCSVEAAARLRNARSSAPAVEAGNGPAPRVDWRGPGAVLGVLAGGVAAGWSLSSLPWSTASTVSLLVLLFIVGADLGRQRREIASQLRAAVDVVWIAPIALAASAVAGALVSLLMPYGVAGPLAGALGSGWYSLAGPLVTTLDGPSVGGVVLLGNLFRETIAMLTIPWLAAHGWSRQAAAALGGATAMDTTLPFVVRGWGPRGAVTSLGVGISLSLAGTLLIVPVWELVRSIWP